jgi:hypothetical protein
MQKNKGALLMVSAVSRLSTFALAATLIPIALDSSNAQSNGLSGYPVGLSTGVLLGAASSSSSESPKVPVAVGPQGNSYRAVAANSFIVDVPTEGACKALALGNPWKTVNCISPEGKSNDFVCVRGELEVLEGNVNIGDSVKPNNRVRTPYFLHTKEGGVESHLFGSSTVDGIACNFKP